MIVRTSEFLTSGSIMLFSMRTSAFDNIVVAKHPGVSVIKLIMALMNGNVTLKYLSVLYNVNVTVSTYK